MKLAKVAAVLLLLSVVAVVLVAKFSVTESRFACSGTLSERGGEVN